MRQPWDALQDMGYKGQAVNWFLTVHNYRGVPIGECISNITPEMLWKAILDDWLHDNPDLTADDFPIRAMSGQIELGEETKKHHLQVTVQFKQRQRLSKLRFIFGEGFGFAKVCRSLEHSINYCVKEDTRVAGPFTYGVFTKKGERKDLRPLDEMARSVRDGVSLEAVILSNPTVAARGLRMLQTIARPKRRYHTTRFVHFWGPSGTGKSKGICDLLRSNTWLDDHVYWKRPFNRWWDGYSGQAITIIDDFDHLHPDIPWKEFISLLDSKPFAVEIKGRQTEFTSHLVILLSSMCFAGDGIELGWYPDRADKSELLRRLQTHGKEQYVGPVGAGAASTDNSEVVQRIFAYEVSLLQDMYVIPRGGPWLAQGDEEGTESETDAPSDDFNPRKRARGVGLMLEASQEYFPPVGTAADHPFLFNAASWLSSDVPVPGPAVPMEQSAGEAYIPGQGADGSVGQLPYSSIPPGFDF